MDSYLQDLAWDYYMSFFAHLYQSYESLIYAKILFPLNIFRNIW